MPGKNPFDEGLLFEKQPKTLEEVSGEVPEEMPESEKVPEKNIKNIKEVLKDLKEEECEQLPSTPKNLIRKRVLKEWRGELIDSLNIAENIYDLAKIRDEMLENIYSIEEKYDAVGLFEEANIISKTYYILSEIIRNSDEYKQKIKEGKIIEQEIENKEIEIDPSLEDIAEGLRHQKRKIGFGPPEYSFGINISIEGDRVIIKKSYKAEFSEPIEKCYGVAFDKLLPFLKSDANALAHTHPISHMIIKELKEKYIRKALGPNTQDLKMCERRKVPSMVITSLAKEKPYKGKEVGPLFYLYFPGKDEILELIKQGDFYEVERYSKEIAV